MSRSAAFRASATQTVLESCFNDPDSNLVAEVVSFVDGQFRRLPPHLRHIIRIVGGYLLLSSTIRLRGWLWQASAADRRAVVTGWEGSGILPVRQYSRLLRSLVLFAAYECSLGAELDAAPRNEPVSRGSG
jgi:hypothetical protein